MGGIFGIVSKEDCVSDLFYGTDYHSHLGTRYGGMAVRNGKGIEFINFSTSRSTLDLAGRKSIHELEGGETADLSAYARAGTEQNLAMIEGIRRRLRLTTLKYQRLEDLVAAIGLPKEKLCTHCWDGSSYF